MDSDARSNDMHDEAPLTELYHDLERRAPDPRDLETAYTRFVAWTETCEHAPDLAAKHQGSEIPMGGAAWSVPSPEDAVGAAIQRVEDLAGCGALDEGAVYVFDRLIDSWVEVWQHWATEDHQSRLTQARAQVFDARRDVAYTRHILHAAELHLTLVRDTLHPLERRVPDGFEFSVSQTLRQLLQRVVLWAMPASHTYRTLDPATRRLRQALDHHNQAKGRLDESQHTLEHLEADRSYVDDCMSAGELMREQIRLRLAQHLAQHEDVPVTDVFAVLLGDLQEQGLVTVHSVDGHKFVSVSVRGCPI